MYLYFYQIEELLEIISKNQCVVGGTQNANLVTEQDISFLLKYGVDFKKLYIKNQQTIFNPFNIAMLVESLRVAESSHFNYDELLAFIKKGKYIPQTAKEKHISKRITNQSFKEISNYENVDIIKNEIIAGIEEKKTARQIASNIGDKTGHWGLEDIVSHYQSEAWADAKVEEIKRLNKGLDPFVYKLVGKSGCCEHCIKLYLTNGKGSQPIVFKLSELEANGSNDERRIIEWKPTLMLTHRLCSCILYKYSDAYLWDSEKQSFSTPDPDYKKRTAAKRALVRVIINGEEHYL